MQTIIISLVCLYIGIAAGSCLAKGNFRSAVALFVLGGFVSIGNAVYVLS